MVIVQVLQRSVDKDLQLYTDLKDMSSPPVGYVTMLSLCSQPVDDNGVRKVTGPEAGLYVTHIARYAWHT